MKIITAYVRKEQAARLLRTLHEAGVGGLSAYFVRGMSGETATFLYSKHPFELSHLPESVKLEIICEDGSLDRMVALIGQGAKTGFSGDGIIAIQDVERVVKIREL